MQIEETTMSKKGCTGDELNMSEGCINMSYNCVCVCQFTKNCDLPCLLFFWACGIHTHKQDLVQGHLCVLYSCA